MTAVTTSLSQILADGGATFWLPRNASNLAGNVDIAFNLLLYICTFFFMVIVGAMTFFIIKYRRKTANDETPLITHNTPLEILWTGIPLVLVVVFFASGFFTVGPIEIMSMPGIRWRITPHSRPAWMVVMVGSTALMSG